MSDEFSLDFPYQKRTFISKLNPESLPFEPSSSYHHIQEVVHPKLSSENNKNNFHIQPITNGCHDNQNYHATTIHSIESSEYQPSSTHYIQEIFPANQDSTTSYHIESVNNDLFQHSLSQNKDIDNTNKEENINQDLSIFNNEEVLSDTHVEETSVNETTLDKQSNLDQSSIHLENNTFPSGFESNMIDRHPLTELESSSSLPDVVAETLENTPSSLTRSTEPDDILGNKSILKQTITPGASDTRPPRNALATVSYKLFLIDTSTTNSHLIETVTNESFFIGEYDILPAIDITIQLMDRGEHASIESDIRHCYGEIGCEEKNIPPVTSTKPYRMKIDLEFHDWKDASDIQTLSVDERLYWSDKKRQRGNFSYRRKDYSAALQCYRNALKFLDTNENPLSEEENDEKSNQSSILNERYIQIQNNLAQVYLLNNQYEQCLGAVNDVLKYDPKNIKALFRQGKAFFELGDYDQALQPLKLLLQNQNKDIEKDKVREMLNICETKLAKYQKNEKEIYKRMFQSKTSVNEKPQIKNVQKIENKNTNTWWTYVAMGSAVLAAVGLAAVIKYR